MDRTLKRWVDVESHLKADTAFGFIDRSSSSSQLFHPKLITNSGNDTMLAAIKAELRRSTSFTFSVAFVSSQAVATLKQALLEFTGTGTIITSTYLSFNTPGAFKELLNIPGVEVYVFDEESGFHPKGYVFQQHQTTTAIVGSSNLTATALSKNSEWNLRFSAMPDGDIVTQLQVAIEDQLKKAKPLTHEWIADYEKRYVPPERRRVIAPSSDELRRQYDEEPAIVANEMQQEALVEIQKVRDQGEKRAIVVSATGTGKTILAALDVQAVAPRRMLFVVHREQIIDRAIEEFKRVLRAPDNDFGKFVGSVKQIDRKYIFATNLSLASSDEVSRLPRDYFDYIIVDEAHRSVADSYGVIFNHFAPKFLLGFTATPERPDSENVFEIFDYNVPYEIRLHDALSRDMLSPFHYYGVTDYETEDGTVISDASLPTQLVFPERVDHIVRALETYGHVGDTTRGLIFCSRNNEAHELSEALNRRNVHGKTLRTVALTGEDTPEYREREVQRLEIGDLDYIITVDVFNEGIDIPSLNQVVMLRKTESSIIFTQQLGRGLRKAVGKDHLRVIDFIGNYANNFLIPIALFGDNSLDKDSLRRHLRHSEEVGVISGVSSVNFDEISKHRIFKAIQQSKLGQEKDLVEAYRSLEVRLGNPPKLIDFARFETVDPVVIASARKNYWNFLHQKIKAVESGPSEIANGFLTFLTLELLPAHRPHELLVLRELLEHGSLTRAEVKRLLIGNDCLADEKTIDSVIRTLDLSFYTAPEQQRFGGIPVLSCDTGMVTLNSHFSTAYGNDELFHESVSDLIETGLYRSRHQKAWSQGLVVGNQYSRKTICRLLGWEKQQVPQNISGYKTDDGSATCPIFVVYHKAEDIADSIKYEDEFEDRSTLTWFSKHSRTLNSPDMKRILSGDYALHIFVKKDDAEGKDFFYLGEATPGEPSETQVKGPKGKPVSAVTMDLHLNTEVEISLFDYLTTPSMAV